MSHGNECSCPLCVAPWRCACSKDFGINPVFRNRKARVRAISRHQQVCSAGKPSHSALKRSFAEVSGDDTCTGGNECTCPVCVSLWRCDSCETVLGPFTKRKNRLASINAHPRYCMSSRASGVISSQGSSKLREAKFDISKAPPSRRRALFLCKALASCGQKAITK